MEQKRNIDYGSDYHSAQGNSVRSLIDEIEALSKKADNEVDAKVKEQIERQKVEATKRLAVLEGRA